MNEADQDPVNWINPANYAGDPTLRGLVAAANAFPRERFPITLMVGGLIISGALISRKEYVERSLEAVEEAGASGVLLRAAQGPFIMLADDEFDHGETIVMAREFGAADAVHLADCSTREGQTTTKYADGVCRFQLDRIDGWMFGRAGE